jgi:hypothetical protein
MEQIMNTNRKRTFALAVAAVAIIPLGLASPAQASVTKDGCTITAKAPYFAGTVTAGNLPEVIYPYKLVCVASPAAMSVEVKTETYDQDLVNLPGDVDADGVNNADEDYIGQATSNTNFTAAGGTRTVKIKGVLKHTDTDFDEELWHKTKLRVTSGLVTGAWSDFDLSQPTTIGW